MGVCGGVWGLYPSECALDVSRMHISMKSLELLREVSGSLLFSEAFGCVARS